MMKKSSMKDFEKSMEQSLKRVKRAENIRVPAGFENGIWDRLGETNPSIAGRIYGFISGTGFRLSFGAAFALTAFFMVSYLINTAGPARKTAEIAPAPGRVKPAVVTAAAPGMVVPEQAKNHAAMINGKYTSGSGTGAANPGVLAVKPAQENKAGAYGMQYSIKPAAAAGVLNAPPAVLEKAGGLSEASAPKKCTGSAGEMKVPLEVRNTVLNPAKGEVVQIKYRLYAAGPVLIRVYDRKGRMIRTICRDEKAAGIYEELWKCDDDGGSIVNAGIYILYVKTAGTEQKIKIGIIK